MGVSKGTQHGQQKPSLLQDQPLTPVTELVTPQHAHIALSAEVRTLLSACSSSHWSSRVPGTVYHSVNTNPHPKWRDAPLLSSVSSSSTGKIHTLPGFNSAWVLPSSAFAPTLFHDFMASSSISHAHL